jgi:hypothetical protein
MIYDTMGDVLVTGPSVATHGERATLGRVLKRPWPCTECGMLLAARRARSTAARSDEPDLLGALRT